MIDVSSKLHGSTLTAVEAQLGELLAKSRASHALIIDLRGFALLHVGASGAPKAPSLDALGSLIASNFSATTALARLFGEKGFKELTQQGKDIGTYTEELGDAALLVTVFSITEPLGRIKYLSKKTVEALHSILTADGEPPPVLTLDADWEQLNDELFDTLLPNTLQPKTSDA